MDTGPISGRRRALTALTPSTPPSGMDYSGTSSRHLSGRLGLHGAFAMALSVFTKRPSTHLLGGRWGGRGESRGGPLFRVLSIGMEEQSEQPCLSLLNHLHWRVRIRVPSPTWKSPRLRERGLLQQTINPKPQTPNLPPSLSLPSPLFPPPTPPERSASLQNSGARTGASSFQIIRLVRL
jgi:hypothetical protein